MVPARKANEAIVQARELRAGDVVCGLVRNRVVRSVKVERVKLTMNTYVWIEYCDGSRDSGLGHLPVVVRLDWVS